MREACLTRCTGRSKLQGRAGQLLDVNVLARLWPMWPEERRQLVQDIAGVQTGLLYSDTSRDEREGWLPNTHFRVHTHSCLGVEIMEPGCSCAIKPAQGLRKGVPCGVRLDVHGRHVGGACKAGGGRTRIHHSCKWRLASSLRQARLNVDCEVVVPELWDAEKGTAAVMDLVVSAPGGISRCLIDVRTLDSLGAHGFPSQGAALDDAASGKFRRYGATVWPFALELCGQLHAQAVQVLELLAGEAAQLPDAAPAPLLVRRWRRALECALAFGVVEARRLSGLGRARRAA